MCVYASVDNPKACIDDHKSHMYSSTGISSQLYSRSNQYKTCIDEATMADTDTSISVVLSKVSTDIGVE